MNKPPPAIRSNTIKDWLKTYSEGPRLVQLGIYWIIFVVLLLFIVNYPAGLAQWQFFGTVITLTALLALNLVWLNPDPAASEKMQAAHDWAFVLISAALIFATIWLSGQTDLIYIFPLVCGQTAIKRGVWPAGVVFGAAIVIIWFGYLSLNGNSLNAIIAVGTSLLTGIMLILLMVTLVNGYSRQTKRAEALLAELQVANARLETAREKEKDLAIAEERVRMARDIHDGLGHHLTVLSIQLQAAGKLVDRDPQAAAQAIQVCRSEAQAALEEVRQSVGIMRQSPAQSQPLPETLASLVASFDQHARMHASFECTGAPVELSSFARQTLFRTAQEGLTNAQKHAVNVRQVQVCLAYEPMAVRLSVHDDGQKLDGALSNPPGFGLKGLSERASQLGGDFRSSPGATGGFEIEICLPIQENENDPRATG